MTLEPPTIWRPCSTGVSQRSRLPIQVRCPGFQAFHQRSTTIRSGEATWQSDPNSSPTSPTRSKITPAEVLASQPGHRREVTRACRSSAKLQCGVPPTASIPKTRDQPEEAASSVQQPPSGNSDSTGTPPVPRIRQAPRDMTNDTQHTHPTESLPARQQAPIPNARSASEQASRSRPLIYRRPAAQGLRFTPSERQASAPPTCTPRPDRGTGPPSTLEQLCHARPTSWPRDTPRTKMITQPGHRHE